MAPFVRMLLWLFFPVAYPISKRGVCFEVTYSSLTMDAQVRRQVISNAKARGKKAGHEGEAHRKENGASTSEQHEVNDKHIEDSSEETNARSHEHAGEEHANEEGGQNKKRSRGRGKGRGRSQYHHQQNNHRGTHVGTPPSNNLLFMEQPILAKQPPGPRMPDGTRGFSRGRGKPLSLTLQ